MGEVAGAGLLAHVPTIMLPYADRLELNEGKEISLVPGLEHLGAEPFQAGDQADLLALVQFQPVGIREHDRWHMRQEPRPGHLTHTSGLASRLRPSPHSSGRHL